jgi:hypothetical protein
MCEQSSRNPDESKKSVRRPGTQKVWERRVANVRFRFARFLLTQYWYQNGEKYTKLPQHSQIAIKYSK